MPWQVERYPKQPAPYGYMDWKQRAIDFDNYVFSGTNNPFTLRWDDTHYNMPTQTFAMTSYIGDTRALVNGEQEALAGFQAVLSGALVGIDKTQFPFGDGHAIDYVSRLQTFYHKTATRRSLYNKPQPDAVKAGHFTSWWYDHASLPMVYALATKYPNITWMQNALRDVADDQYDMLVTLGGANASFYHQAFNHDTNQVFDDTRKEVDAGFVTALVEYWAYRKYGDAKYLDGARWALGYYFTANANPVYEYQTVFGPYLAARLNAEQGGNYNVTQLLDWILSPTSPVRTDWGTILANWGGYDVYGVQGSNTDGGGYGFAMETFATAWLAPMVRYDHRYARMVGRHLLNVSNAARFFYADQMNALNQYYGSTYINNPAKVVPYEGLRKIEDGQTPRATGDPHHYGAQWGLDPNTKDLALYGGSWAGLFGAIIKSTNVSKLLQIDLNALDFYADSAYPTYLYYNPYDTAQTVQLPVTGSKDLFNPITGAFIAQNVSGTSSFVVPADDAVMVVVAPANSSLTYSGNRTNIGSVTVAFQPPNYNSSNLAYASSASASSTQPNSGNAARSVVDGELLTRWESQVSDPQWIQVDLGQNLSVGRVKLRWESAYARAYQIQTSSDGTTWTTAFSTTTGDGDLDDIAFTARTARYVRANLTQRATTYAYSLYEFEVYAN